MGSCDKIVMIFFVFVVVCLFGVVGVKMLLLRIIIGVEEFLGLFWSLIFKGFFLFLVDLSMVVK